jgi:hypothetical protein
MRRLRLGFGLTRGRAGPAASFSVSITGGSSDSLGTYAQVGGHASIGYVETPTSGIETVKWSNSSNPADAATYGTGANPTDFTAGDGGTLWLHVTIGAETVSRSLPIRRAAGSFAALSNQSFTDDTGNQTYVFSAATGTGLTWTYALTSPPSGVTINSGTRTITFDTAALAVQAGTVITVTATDQYGRAATGSPRTFTLTIAAPTQATGGADLDLSYPAGSTITPQNLIANWTLNGNTLTFVSVSPPLPSDLSINSSGSLSGTPATVTADATYTLTMADIYARQTSDTFTLQITAADAAPFATGVVAGAQAGNDIPIDIEDLSENSTVFYVLLTGGSSAPSAAQVVAGTNASNIAAPVAGDFAATVGGGPYNEDIASLEGTYDLYVVLRDSALQLSPVYSDTGLILTSATWATTGGDGVITVTSQPFKPATPTTTGGDGVITITG